MIYIATIHHNNPDWIIIQNNFIRKYTQEQFKLYGWLANIDNKFDKYFDVVIHKSNPNKHGQRLNILTNEILKIANDEDFILFLDGDCFPIKPYLDKLLPFSKNIVLKAIHRIENA